MHQNRPQRKNHLQHIDMKKMKLVLENGMSFSGEGFNSGGAAVGEIVFNTSMIGYQEIISDPSYAGQIVVMTYPLIGQYGITDEDFESKNPLIAGLVVRECCTTPSNFRFTKTLSEELDEHGIPCITGLDTRMITRIIRNEGCMKAAIVEEGTGDAEALALIRNAGPQTGMVAAASCSKRWFSRTPHHKFDVVLIDCGLKHSIISELNRRGCNVTVVPFNSGKEEILSFHPDGILISNGPGNPEELPELVGVIKELKGQLPIFGICLGEDLIALSYGARTYKMKSGHHGGRPVRELETGKIITAEHGHNYAVDENSLDGTGLTVSYRDISDGTIEGLECLKDRVCTVQFNPEGAPGPRESVFFDKFIKMMED